MDQEQMQSVSWDLSTCCGNQEIAFLTLFAGYMVANFFLWNTCILKPMKLIAVFVHEMSHATACWMTCGRVTAIEVHVNEGGVTHYVGGMRCIIIPAGYLGGAFWGCVFVVLSGERVSATISACIFIFALGFALCFVPNKVMVILNLFFILLTGLAVFLEWYVYSPLLQFVTLYYGVTIGTFSVYDIHDDLITRTVEGSDAKACHELIPCCLPRCVGVQFAIIALLFQGLGVYLALVWMSAKS